MAYLVMHRRSRQPSVFSATSFASSTRPEKPPITAMRAEHLYVSGLTCSPSYPNILMLLPRGRQSSGGLHELGRHSRSSRRMYCGQPPLRRISAARMNALLRPEGLRPLLLPPGMLDAHTPEIQDIFRSSSSSTCVR